MHRPLLQPSLWFHTLWFTSDCQQIIKRILVKYPRQSMWTVVGLSKSMLRSRRQAALRVMTQACRQSKSAKSMLAIASSLFKVLVAERLLQRRLAEFVGRLLQDLIDIARAEVSTKHMRLRLKCNDQIRGGAPLLLPVQSALTVTLPPDFTHHHDHEAFVPTEQVCKRVDVSACMQGSDSIHASRTTSIASTTTPKSFPPKRSRRKSRCFPSLAGRTPSCARRRSVATFAKTHA